MSRPLKQISSHFAQVSALLVATWSLKKVLSVIRRPGGGSTEKKDMRKSQSHKFLPSPESQYEPTTAGWMKDWIAVISGFDRGKGYEGPNHIYKKIAVELGSNNGEVGLGTPKALEQLFMLSRADCRYFLNAGSYGAVFRYAAEAQKWFQDLLERQPVYYHEHIVPRAMQAAKQVVADLIKADVEDLVPVVNASAAVNCVLNSISLRSGDIVLVTSVTYAAVVNAVARFTARGGAAMVSVVLDLDTLRQGTQAILQRFQSVISQYGSRLRLAVLDHITSNPTHHMPIKELAELFRASNVSVCCDGAHAVVASPLDVPNLGVDYYTSNLHKWGCCPKSCAFLWVRRECQADMIPTVTSHGYRQGWQAEFAWPGTTDQSAWLAVPTAFRVWNAIGLERARQFNHKTLLEAVSTIREAWGDNLAVLGAEAEFSTMASLELPDLEGFEQSSEGAGKLHACLRERFGIEIPASCWEGRLWVRISAQLFNLKEDYVALRDAIQSLR